MNVTKEEIKYRKLHNEMYEGYLQMVSAERKSMQKRMLLQG